LHGSQLSQTNAAATSNFGVKGVPSAATLPLPRHSAGQGMVDANGRMWLWGGHAALANGDWQPVNDLFYYTPSLNYWCWVAGDAVTYISSFGQFRLPAASNLPARLSHATSIDVRTSKLYLFGGTDAVSYRSDVQQYDIATDTFTWLSGSSATGAAAAYPSAKQQGSAQAHGKAVICPLMWVDPSGGQSRIFCDVLHLPFVAYADVVFLVD
jgi:hypothetical protein